MGATKEMLAAYTLLAAVSAVMFHKRAWRMRRV